MKKYDIRADDAKRGMQKILKRFDMFGVPLPMFNVDGE